MMQTTKLQIRLPTQLKIAIDQHASDNKITSSDLIRKAIAAYMGLDPGATIMRPPGDPIAKSARANTRRRSAASALAYLEQHNPQLLARVIEAQSRRSRNRKAS